MSDQAQRKLKREIEQLKKTWNLLGRKDPLRAIMTGRDWPVEEFFATGVREIQEALDTVAAAGLALPPGDALDFGCGIGRLTQALARHFARVDGLDISPSMIARARELNGSANCTYILNEAADLAILGDKQYDFIYSSITLQHIAPALALHYIAELARVLRPGGVLLFQVPSRSLAPRSPVFRALKRLAPRRIIDLINYCRFGREAAMRMHGIDRAVVTATLERAGCRVVRVDYDRSAGEAWESFRYLAARD